MEKQCGCKDAYMPGKQTIQHLEYILISYGYYSYLMKMKKIFFCLGQGGTRFFLRMPRGGPEFFCACQGGTRKKLATRNHKQTAPLPVKNDSSLNYNEHSLQVISLYAT